MADTTEAKLRGMINEFSVRREANPFSNLVEKICGVTFVNKIDDPYRKRPKNKENIRIALVSMPYVSFDTVPHSSLSEGFARPDGVDDVAFLRQLVSFKADTADRMFNAFSEALETALHSNPPADVICFNELGLPATDMVPMLRAKELAWDKSQKHKALIIAGSAHDSRTLYNTGYVFRPGGPEAGQGFHKSVSARSVGELISAPAHKSVAAVYFAGLRIATMICIDVADYASIASVVKVADGVDVLLVPCYTTKFEKMGAIADLTSKALPGVVALVNADLPGDAKVCRIARFGKSDEPNNELKTPAGAVISMLDINLSQFDEERTRMKTEGTPGWEKVEYLFGRRDMPYFTAST